MPAIVSAMCVCHKYVCVFYVFAHPTQDSGLNSAASSSLCQLCCRQEETQVFLVLSSCGCQATATRPFRRHGNSMSDSGGGQGELFFPNNPPYTPPLPSLFPTIITSFYFFCLRADCLFCSCSPALISTHSDISLATKTEHESLATQQPFFFQQVQVLLPLWHSLFSLPCSS